MLDAGAGAGSYLPLLSELLGSSGSISAVDLAEENIIAMRKRLSDAPLICPVDLVAASVRELPFGDNSFDALWRANTTQYFQLAELPSLLRELCRVVKPGGLVAVKEFDDVGLHFGPFNHQLRWHLFDKVEGSKNLLGAGALFPVNFKTHFLQAGLEQVQLKTSVGDFQHPLSTVQEAFLHSALALYYSLAEQADLPRCELEQWQRKLGDPEHADYILKQADFYFREVHVLATGLLRSNE